MRHPYHHRNMDRRRFPRLPVLDGLIEPVSLRYDRQKRGDLQRENSRCGVSPAPSQPAIMTNLSAGGMSLIIFAEPPHAKRFHLDLNIPGLNHVPIEGRVARVHSKGETFNVGIEFTKISRKCQKQINDVASDYRDCETRIAFCLPEACVPTCRFHCLCQKPQKAPHWPPKV